MHFAMFDLVIATRRASKWVQNSTPVKVHVTNDTYAGVLYLVFRGYRLEESLSKQQTDACHKLGGSSRRFQKG
jgi:hypothetical protein